MLAERAFRPLRSRRKPIYPLGVAPKEALLIGGGPGTNQRFGGPIHLPKPPAASFTGQSLPNIMRVGPKASAACRAYQRTSSRRQFAQSASDTSPDILHTTLGRAAIVRICSSHGSFSPRRISGLAQWSRTNRASG